tara:strand:- start:419 stop:580 length:162 start_codon:yes stop_codon:yes gene_type:complete
MLNLVTKPAIGKKKGPSAGRILLCIKERPENGSGDYIGAIVSNDASPPGQKFV